MSNNPLKNKAFIPFYHFVEWFQCNYTRPLKMGGGERQAGHKVVKYFYPFPLLFLVHDHRRKKNQEKRQMVKMVNLSPLPTF